MWKYRKPDRLKLILKSFAGCPQFGYGMTEKDLPTTRLRHQSNPSVALLPEADEILVYWEEGNGALTEGIPRTSI